MVSIARITIHQAVCQVEYNFENAVTQIHRINIHSNRPKYSKVKCLGIMAAQQNLDGQLCQAQVYVFTS